MGHTFCVLSRRTFRRPTVIGKGFTSQNVLSVVDFDLKFTYVVAGWEGSVHDARVLQDAMSDSAFSFPKPPGGKCHYDLWYMM